MSNELQPPPAAPSPEAGHDLRGGLRSRSFWGLLATQWLGAMNDNAFRMLVVGICMALVAAERSSVVLSAGLACFTLPYLLLAAPAGYLADRFSKRKVIVACKVAEIVIMAAAVGAIYFSQQTGDIILVFLVLALMGSQSALFGPSKLGAIPEMLRPQLISAANGLMGLVTIMATVTGVVVGNALLSSYNAARAAGGTGLGVPALALVGVAVIGTLTSLAIWRLPAASPGRKFPKDVVSQTVRDLKLLASSRPMLRVALGIAFFWGLGALAQSNILEFGAEGGLLQQETNPLLAALVVGVGLGAVLAGIWSGGKVELGILPLGAAGMALGAALLFTVSNNLITGDAAWTASRVWACIWLFLLGTSAGMFSVPLEAYMQHRSEVQTRGAVLAASNFITFSAMLATAGLYLLLRAPLVAPAADTGPPLASLPAAEAAEITAARDRFAADWGAAKVAQGAATAVAGRASLPNPAAYLAGAPDVNRQALLRELIEVDAHQREAHGLRAAVKDYLRVFHSEADVELIRSVLGERAPLFTARGVFLLAGACTLPILVYILWLIPDASVRFLVWLASRTVYRIRIEGIENLPERGGALLVANHVSWLDGVLLLIVSSRPIRMVAHGRFTTGRLARWLARRMGVIPIWPEKAGSVRQAIETARKALRRGELVCVFPEGGITRTGKLGRFKRGMLSMVDGTSAPIIPVYLDELWGSIFSYHGGRFFWKWPRRWPYPVSIYFGPAMRPGGEEPSRNVEQVREAVQSLARKALEKRMSEDFVPPRAFVRNCRANRNKLQVADSLGERLTGGQLLLRTLVLRRLLLREVLADDEQYIGILIPPSAGAVVVNAALPLVGRVGVNLNYTLSKAEMDYCVRQCGIRHVLTTRRVMEKLKVNVDAELVYLDDFRSKVTLADKLSAAFMARCLPLGMLERKLGLDKMSPDDVLTVIFTSGSTSQPKGVMLTNRNVGSNVAAIREVVHLTDDDVLLGALPFFHSLGYTATLWTVLTLNPRGVYHFSPLDAKIIGRLCREYGVTILLATPTFLRSYLKRCQPEDFARLDVVVAGAEKLPKDVCDAFEKKFGVRPVEGYGTTELSPLVSVNIPEHRAAGATGTVREGSVGRPVPGVEARIVHPDTREPLGLGEEGLLLVRGPNVMKGYLNQEEKTAEVIRDGWYETGDMAVIDEDGFIHITGRLSRFSKIGGEMVPHLKVEEELLRVLGGDDEGELRAAVTAVPDARKGERLVVLHVPMDKTPQQVRQALADAGLPNIFLPSADSFYEVDEIPVLGTGKLDLKRLKQMALERCGEKRPAANGKKVDERKEGTTEAQRQGG